jgi:hypothetical protein
MTKKTLVLGGSLKPERYSNKAIRRLVAYKHSVVSIGLKSGLVGEVLIETGMPSFKDIHTVTMYLNPQNQQPYWDYIIGLSPKRIVFNPGTENPAFAQICTDAGIEVIEHCTLVMLDAGIY